MSANGSPSLPNEQKICAALIRRKQKIGWIVKKCAYCQALASERYNITEVAGDWLILKSVARFIINLPILKEFLRTAKHKINHPNKLCLMRRTKEDYPSFILFSIVGTWESVNLNPTIIIYRSDKEYLLLYIYRKPQNRLHPLLMRYSEMVASILLPLHPNGSMQIMIRQKMYLVCRIKKQSNLYLY